MYKYLIGWIIKSKFWFDSYKLYNNFKIYFSSEILNISDRSNEYIVQYGNYTIDSV